MYSRLWQVHSDFSLFSVLLRPRAQQFLSQKVNVTVQTYKPWVFWSRALATTYPGTVIQLNAYQLKRSVSSFVDTLIHECVHIADNHPEQLCFGHGNNYSKGKENTAPYKSGAISEEIASQGG